MKWLAGQGHPVVGNELSGIALRDFFATVKLEPAVHETGDCKRWSAGDYELLEGDFFALSSDDLGTVDAVYDRAALVALPPDMRARHADKLASLTSSGTPVLLVTMNYDPARMSGPLFAVTPAEVEALYRDRFDIRALGTTDALPDNPRFRERGLTWLDETGWILRRR